MGPFRMLVGSPTMSKMLMMRKNTKEIKTESQGQTGKRRRNSLAISRAKSEGVMQELSPLPLLQSMYRAPRKEAATMATFSGPAKAVKPKSDTDAVAAGRDPHHEETKLTNCRPTTIAMAIRALSLAP